jgi:hypothetical protein
MKTLLLLSLLALTTTVYSTNYYVSNTGNDSNNGRSPSTAWQTLKNVNSQKFQPGDSILFERGGVWIERLEITSSGSKEGQISYSAYGEGERPIFSGVHEVPGWDNEKSWTNLGNNRWSMDIRGRNNVRIWINDEPKLRSQSNQVDGVTKDHPWQKWNYVFYLYSEGNPAKTYYKVESSNNSQFFASTPSSVDYITLSHLNLKGWDRITIRGCSHWIIEYCDIGWGAGGYGLEIRRDGSTFSKNGIIRNCNIDSGFRFQLMRYRTPYSTLAVQHGLNIGGGVSDWHIHDNYFRGWGHADLALVNHADEYPCNGIKHYNNYHTNKDGNYGRAFGVHLPISRADPDNPCEIFNNVIYEQGVQSQIAAPGLKVYNNIFNITRGVDNDPSSTAANGLSFSGYPGRPAYRMKIYNNIFANSNFVGLFWSARPDREPIEECEVVNNIFYNNGRSEFWVNNEKDKVIKPVIKNNIFYTPSNRSNAIRIYDRNLDVESFNALDGSDNHGYNTSGNLWADPLFVDPENGDFRLRENSPAIGAGLKPLSETDHYGNLWQTPYSIGPYETTNTSYVLTLTAEGEGSIAVIPALNYYPPGTVVHLSAQPGDEWQFSGWNGDINSGNSEISLVIESNMNILAHFTSNITDSEMTEMEEKVRIYPNPATDYFTISMDEPEATDKTASFRIIDMAGRIVYNDILNRGKAIVQIPRHLRAGVYIVELIREGFPFHSQRLMIRN